MSILSALHRQKESLDDLAALPQNMIMQMAQRKEIAPEMVAPILSRKAEMAESSARTKALQNAPAQQPTVMDNLMAKNAQTQEQGLAQLHTDEREFAGGGIVAFSGGDYVDDEDYAEQQEDQEMAEHQAAINASLAHMMRNHQSAPEQTSEATHAGPQEVVKEKTVHKVQAAKGNHPYRELVAKDAVKIGVDPNISLRLLQNETGGLKNPEKAVSPAGAMGIAQFMPATAKQYGIDPFKPEEASRGMNEHVHHLMKKYGDPQLVAIAYNWGEGNTNKWLRNGADPDKLPKETQGYLQKFMTSALAQGGAVGYAAGGKIERKTYEEQMSKAFGYKPHLGPVAQHYLSGGEVEHFAGPDGSLVSKPMPEKATSTIGDFLESTGVSDVANALREKYYKSKEFEKQMEAAEDVFPGIAEPLTPTERAKRIAAGERLFKGPQSVPTLTPKQIEEARAQVMGAPKRPKVTAPTSYDQTREAEDASSFGIIPRTAPTPTGKPLPEQVPVEDKYERYLKMAEEQMSASKKQRESDRNMAMIAAGLGIFGGDSPYAAVNIGKGGLHGVQYLSEANKQRAAEENAALGRVGSLMRYKELGEQNRQNRDYIKEQKELDRGARVKAQDEQSLLSYQKIRMAPYEARAKLAISDEDRVRILAEGEQALYSDPRFLKKLGKYDPDLATLTPAPSVSNQNWPIKKIGKPV